jgi:hypothetical protein
VCHPRRQPLAAVADEEMLPEAMGNTQLMKIATWEFTFPAQQAEFT